MRALERNRELRYQTAWDMLADIDMFLSGQRFVPTNIHLSNFMRQIFSEELERPLPEELAEEEEAPAPGGEEETRIVEAGACAAAAPSTAGAPCRLTLEIGADHFQALSELARRQKRQPAELAGEIVSRFAGLLRGRPSAGEEE